MTFKEKKRWVFFGLPFTFTTYTVNEQFVTVDSGFLNRKQNDCYMYKIVDTRLCVSLWERIFKLGTVECYCGDVTTPVLTLTHIRNAKAVKDFILEASEDQRIKRRTVNTQNLAGDFDNDLDADGIPDELE